VDTRRAVDLDVARRVLMRRPVAHLAVVGPQGPHVVPVWFVWDPNALYCAVWGGTATHRHLRGGGRAAVAVDAGEAWEELGGAVVTGPAKLLRPDRPDLRGPVSRWYEKYGERFGLAGFRWFSETVSDPWFARITPETLAWWDHGEGPFSAWNDAG